jgi:hypothetical protein
MLMWCYQSRVRTVALGSKLTICFRWRLMYVLEETRVSPVGVLSLSGALTNQFSFGRIVWKYLCQNETARIPLIYTLTLLRTIS